MSSTELTIKSRREAWFKLNRFTLGWRKELGDTYPQLGFRYYRLFGGWVIYRGFGR